MTIAVRARACGHVSDGDPDPCPVCWAAGAEDELDPYEDHFCYDPSCCDQGDTVNPIPHGLPR